MADTSEDAYGKVVDRLMDSDEYAERMTSSGSACGLLRYLRVPGRPQPKASGPGGLGHSILPKEPTLRPLHTEQVAGDLIPNATRDQILATCFNRLHPQKVEGGSVPEEFRIDRDRPGAYLRHGLSRSDLGMHPLPRPQVRPRDPKGLFLPLRLFNNIDEAGLYSYFTGSYPPPHSNSGICRATRRSGKRKQNSFQSANPRKRIGLSVIGRTPSKRKESGGPSSFHKKHSQRKSQRRTVIRANSSPRSGSMRAGLILPLKHGTT